MTPTPPQPHSAQSHTSDAPADAPIIDDTTPVIVYDSVYGASKQYADALAATCGTTAIPHAELPTPPRARPLVIVSPNYAGQVAGIAYAKKLFASADITQPVALLVVGMTLSDVIRAQDPAAKWLGPLAETIERFYLPGRLIHSGLSRVHKTALWSLNSFLKAKPKRSENDDNMLAEYGKDIDRVDVGELQPVLEWIQAVSSSNETAHGDAPGDAPLDA